MKYIDLFRYRLYCPPWRKYSFQILEAKISVLPAQPGDQLGDIGSRTWHGWGIFHLWCYVQALSIWEVTFGGTDEQLAHEDAARQVGGRAKPTKTDRNSGKVSWSTFPQPPRVKLKTQNDNPRVPRQLRKWNSLRSGPYLALSLETKSGLCTNLESCRSRGITYLNLHYRNQYPRKI